LQGENRIGDILLDGDRDIQGFHLIGKDRLELEAERGVARDPAGIQRADHGLHGLLVFILEFHPIGGAGDLGDADLVHIAGEHIAAPTTHEHFCRALDV